MQPKKGTGRGGVRPGAGRKAKPTHERLRNRVMFTLTDEEFEALMEATGHESVSAYLRRLVVRHLARRRR
jgi:hypothetical protein